VRERLLLLLGLMGGMGLQVVLWGLVMVLDHAQSFALCM